MPTIGRTAATTNHSTGLAANNMLGRKDTLTERGLITKVTAHLDGLGSGTGSQVGRASVYAADGSGGKAGTLLGISQEVTVVNDAADANIDFVFLAPFLASAQALWTMLHFGGNANVIQIYRATSGGTSLINIVDAYADGPEDPCNAGTASTNDYWIYLTYTASPTAIDYTKSVFFATGLATATPGTPGAAQYFLEEGVDCTERSYQETARVFYGPGAYGLNSTVDMTAPTFSDGVALGAGAYQILVPEVSVQGTGSLTVTPYLLVGATTITGTPRSFTAPYDSYNVPFVVTAASAVQGNSFGARLKVTAIGASATYGISIAPGLPVLSPLSAAYGANPCVQVGAQEGEADSTGWLRSAPVLSVTSPANTSHESPVALTGNPVFEMATSNLYGMDTVRLRAFDDTRRDQDHQLFTSRQQITDPVWVHTVALGQRGTLTRALRIPFATHAASVYDPAKRYGRLSDIC